MFFPLNLPRNSASGKKYSFKARSSVHVRSSNSPVHFPSLLKTENLINNK